VVSIKKRDANKKNACLSTGPRTQAGKLRSRANALRHGLATAIADDLVLLKEIERLAGLLVNTSDDRSLVVQAHIVAECHLELRRIRAARHRALREIAKAEIEQLEPALVETARFHRYMRRALSRRRTKLRNLVLETLQK